MVQQSFLLLKNMKNEYETLYVPVATLSTKDNQKLSKLLSKGLKDQFIGMSVKQKVRIKIQQITTNISRIKLYRIQYIVFFLIFSNEDGHAKSYKAKRYYLPKRTIS